MTFGSSGVININATVSGITKANGDYADSTPVNPYQEIFPSGTYTASITSPATSPLQASYGGWSFDINTPTTPTYLEDFAAFNDNGGSPLMSSPVIEYQSSMNYLTAAQALAAAAGWTETFVITASETLDFVVPDNYLTDNSGGVSVAITRIGAAPEPFCLWIVAAASLLTIRPRRRTA